MKKIDSDGKRTVISSQKSGSSKSGNRNALAATFDNFKSGLEKAEAGEELTYSDENVTSGRGGGFFGGRDIASSVTLSDGTVISSSAGKTANEVATVRRLADEIGAAYIEKEEEGADGDGNGEGGEETVLDTVTNETLTDVENISDDTFGVDIETEDGVVNSTDTIENYFDNTATSVNTAAGQQTNMESALTTSVGEAEDEAISYMTSGTGSNILTTAQGLLAGDDEDEFDVFNRRKTLIGA